MDFTVFNALVSEIKDNDIPVIIEGKKDKLALEELGLSKIITLHKKPIFQIMEELKAEEVVILTDLDKEGKKLYGKLCQECTRLGIKVNNKLRNFLLKETELSCIEGLGRYLSHLEEKKFINKSKFFFFTGFIYR